MNILKMILFASQRVLYMEVYCLTLALLVPVLMVEHVSSVATLSANHQGSSYPNSSKSSTNLGVRVARPVYALIPRTRGGHHNVTVALTIWLRRVGATKGPYDMAHQSKDSIRLLVWVDTPRDLHMRVYGHLKLPTEHSEWKPRLRIETPLPGPILEASLEPGDPQYHSVWGTSPRPYSFSVHLPAGMGNCFKIIETSYPKHKAPVCLPPPASDDVCDTLAPPDVFTPAKPALYTVVGPVRHGQSTRDWNTHMSWVSGRLINYVSYHVAMGVTGLLQYTDELMRSYLMRNPRIVDLVQQGHLRLIEWDMPERAHDDADGAGRPLGYNYDQALVASHALLGLSACGTNLVVLVTDMDEYLYFPKHGRRWPKPWGDCMGPPKNSTAGNMAPPVTVFKVQRYDLVTSSVSSNEESRLWATPGALPPATNNTEPFAVGASGGHVEPLHPMSRYDLIFKRPIGRIYVKQAQLPAARVVLFFVHEGVAMTGRSQLVHHRCMALLHIANFFRGRRGVSTDGGSNKNGKQRHQDRRRKSEQPHEWRPFRHWLFLEPNASVALWEL